MCAGEQLQLTDDCLGKGATCLVQKCQELMGPKTEFSKILSENRQVWYREEIGIFWIFSEYVCLGSNREETSFFKKITGTTAQTGTVRFPRRAMICVGLAVCWWGRPA